MRGTWRPAPPRGCRAPAAAAACWCTGCRGPSRSARRARSPGARAGGRPGRADPAAPRGWGAVGGDGGLAADDAAVVHLGHQLDHVGGGGHHRPTTASTRADSETAWSKLPSRSVRPARNRLPKLWPASSPEAKRCSNSWPTSDSSSASADRQWRTSPGAGMPKSRRSRPELPPSSVVVTTAVTLLMRLRPRRIIDRPVPPPRQTTRGRLRERDVGTSSNCGGLVGDQRHQPRLAGASRPV